MKPHRQQMQDWAEWVIISFDNEVNSNHSCMNLRSIWRKSI